MDLQPRCQAAHFSPGERRHRQVHLARSERRRPPSGGDHRTSEGHALAPADHRCTRRVVGRPPHPADDRQRILSDGWAPITCCTSLPRARATASGSCRAMWPPRCGARRTPGSSEGPRSRATGVALHSRSGKTDRRCCASQTSTARTLASSHGRSSCTALRRGRRTGNRSRSPPSTTAFHVSSTFPLDGRSPARLVEEHSVGSRVVAGWRNRRVLGARHRDDIPDQGRRRRRQRAPSAETHIDSRRQTHRIHAGTAGRSWWRGETSSTRISG